MRNQLLNKVLDEIDGIKHKNIPPPKYICKGSIVDADVYMCGIPTDGD